MGGSSLYQGRERSRTRRRGAAEGISRILYGIFAVAFSFLVLSASLRLRVIHFYIQQKGHRTFAGVSPNQKYPMPIDCSSTN